MEIDWNKMARPWLQAETGLESAHRNVLASLLRRAKLKPGQRVLDIGCGTGASLLAVADFVGEQGRVTGVDIAPPLVARADARTPDHVNVIVSDAATHQPDELFDAAVSQFGTMFFADTPAAFTNIRNALRPGAQFTFAAWGPAPENPWFGIPRAAIEAHLGPLPKPDPALPGPFRFADASALIALLGPCGWRVTAETEALTLSTNQSASGLAEMHMIVAEGAMLANNDLTDNDRAAIKANLREGFGALGSGDALEVPAVVHFFTAIAV